MININFTINNDDLEFFLNDTAAKQGVTVNQVIRSMVLSWAEAQLRGRYVRHVQEMPLSELITTIGKLKVTGRGLT